MSKLSELIDKMDGIRKDVDDCIMPVDYPLTSEQEKQLVTGKDCVHIILGAFPLTFSGLYTLLNVCKTIEERGGIRGDDYIICIHDIDGEKRLVVDTINSYFCDEGLVK